VLQLEKTTRDGAACDGRTGRTNAQDLSGPQAIVSALELAGCFVVRPWRCELYRCCSWAAMASAVLGVELVLR
jgi:hypothetical protein